MSSSSFVFFGKIRQSESTHFSFSFIDLSINLKYDLKQNTILHRLLIITFTNIKLQFKHLTIINKKEIELNIIIKINGLRRKSLMRERPPQ